VVVQNGKDFVDITSNIAFQLRSLLYNCIAFPLPPPLLLPPPKTPEPATLTTSITYSEVPYRVQIGKSQSEQRSLSPIASVLRSWTFGIVLPFFPVTLGRKISVRNVGQDVPPAADRLPEPFKSTGWQSMLQCSMHVVSTMLSRQQKKCRGRINSADFIGPLSQITLFNYVSSNIKTVAQPLRLVPYIRSNFDDDVFVIAVLLLLEKGCTLQASRLQQ